MTNYFDFLTTGGATNTNTTGATTINKPSAGQIKYYTDLCAQRNIVPEDTTKWSFDDMSAKIKELLEFTPLSPKQLTLIKTKVELLAKFGKIVDVPKGLEGGLNKSGSDFIQTLFDMEKEFADLDTPSDKQLDMLVGMYLCPDIAFEDYHINKRISLSKLTPEDKAKYKELLVLLDKGVFTEVAPGSWEYIPASQDLIDEFETIKKKVTSTWRKMTPEEFKKELATKLNKATASELINKSTGVFYEWKNTRIRPEQMKYIRTLESRLAYQPVARAVEFAVSDEGEIIEVNVAGKESIPGAEYNPIQDDELIMFTIPEADEFIGQLRMEVERRESNLVEEEQDYDELRVARNQKEAMDIEHKAFDDLMYKLLAVAGYEDEELLQASTYSLVADESDDSQKVNRTKIRDFMRELITTQAITFHELITLTQESITAQRILLDM